MSMMMMLMCVREGYFAAGNKCGLEYEGYIGSSDEIAMPTRKHVELVRQKIRPTGNTGFFLMNKAARIRCRSTVQQASRPISSPRFLFVCSAAPVKRKLDHGIGVIPPIISPELWQPTSPPRSAKADEWWSMRGKPHMAAYTHTSGQMGSICRVSSSNTEVTILSVENDGVRSARPRKQRRSRSIEVFFLMPDIPNSKHPSIAISSGAPRGGAAEAQEPED